MIPKYIPKVDSTGNPLNVGNVTNAIMDMDKKIIGTKDYQIPLSFRPNDDKKERDKAYRSR